MDRDKLNLIREYARVCNKYDMGLIDMFSILYDLELFISNIPNIRTRIIFMKRYIDDWTFKEIGQLLDGMRESAIRKIHDTYLNSIELV
ncbi:hypothetical protein SAMN00017477_1579 [Peptoniphilus asaccharolyticus DSM 20463]|uniref:Sigma-70, region 4 n=1 Tax=Peptoniphilus asaccharolyticus DSM 20463 TaxID=573058 RepID=A0A1W1V9M0_PEPAS|nr:hypothetical protein [Peptoniphilus asaccharolyticus]MBL7575751.1 hypothetical protein [Peptoniphilus asaccharolyticus]SMB90147.1 hypothetical protein SAMN00017477_1579 [Peptoniphilus asaccharolyticus DSM 20463]